MGSPLAKYKLSKQEQQVLILTMTGLQDREIAEKMGIRLDTVRVYWKRIRSKTGGATRAEVIALVASETTLGELEAAQRENEQLLSEIVRRRGVEEELAMYREIFARTCAGLAVDGGAGASIIRLNRAFAELHGYTTDELLGRPIEMLFAPPEQGDAPKLKAKVDHLGAALLTEHHVRKDGSTFPVLKQVTSITEGQGRSHFRVYTVLGLEDVQTWQQFVYEDKPKESEAPSKSASGDTPEA